METTTLQTISARFPNPILMDMDEAQLLMDKGLALLQNGAPGPDALEDLERALGASFYGEREEVRVLAHALADVLAQLDASAGDPLGALGDALYFLDEYAEGKQKTGDSELADALDDVSAFAQFLTDALEEHGADSAARYYAFVFQHASKLCELVKAPPAETAQKESAKETAPTPKPAAPSERPASQYVVASADRKILQLDLFEFLRRWVDNEFIERRLVLSRSCAELMDETSGNRIAQINLLEKVAVLDRYDGRYSPELLSDLESRLVNAGCLASGSATNKFVGHLGERIDALNKDINEASLSGYQKTGRFFRSLALLAVAVALLWWTLSDAGVAAFAADEMTAAHTRVLIGGAIAGLLSGGFGSAILGFLAGFIGMSASLFLTKTGADVIAVQVAGGIIACMALFLRNVWKWRPSKMRALQEKQRAAFAGLAQKVELTRLYVEELYDSICIHCDRANNPAQTKGMQAYYNAALDRLDALAKRMQ